MQHLLLIGYRGSGKSTVGAILARHLGRSFFDLDDAVEAAAGCSITEIFAREGEPGFRDRERHALSESIRIPACVLSTGGGIVLNPENRAALQDAGFVAWLTASPEVLWQRMLADPLTASRRPNLQNGGLEEVVAVMGQRESLYAETAHARFDVMEKSPEHIASDILNAYEAWRKSEPEG